MSERSSRWLKCTCSFNRTLPRTLCSSRMPSKLWVSWQTSLKNTSISMFPVCKPKVNALIQFCKLNKQNKSSPYLSLHCCWISLCFFPGFQRQFHWVHKSLKTSAEDRPVPQAEGCATPDSELMPQNSPPTSETQAWRRPEEERGKNTKHFRLL